MNSIDFLTSLNDGTIILDRNNHNKITHWESVYYSTLEHINKNGQVSLDYFSGRIPTFKKLEGDEPSFLTGGHRRLREGSEDIFLEDLNAVQIESFYPTTILGLFKSGLLEVEEYPELFNVMLFIINDMKMFKWRSGGDLKHYNFYKSWVNMGVGLILNKRSNISVTRYTRYVMEQFMEKTNWIFVDTDMMFYYGDFHQITEEPCMSYVLNHGTIEYAYFMNNHKYIYQDEYGLSVKGITRPGKKTDDIMSEIKRRGRDKIIDKLL